MIENTYWKKYNFRFEPNSRYSHIILEAFYKTPTIFPYNGNVLIDNASEIIPVDCDKPTLPPIQDLEDLTVEEEPAEEVVINQAPPQRTIIPQEEPAKQPEVVEEKEEPKPNTFQPKILKELSRTDFKEGETIRINHLYFKADSSIIQPESFDVLDEVYHFLQTNPSYVVEIGGHTNSRPAPEFCFELSTARAREVAEYLNSKGIPWKRLRIKGYGKTKLIANDATAIGRQRNQRVEIKILSLTG